MLPGSLFFLCQLPAVSLHVISHNFFILFSIPFFKKLYSFTSSPQFLPLITPCDYFRILLRFTICFFLLSLKLPTVSFYFCYSHFSSFLFHCSYIILVYPCQYNLHRNIYLITFFIFSSFFLRFPRFSALLIFSFLSCFLLSRTLTAHYLFENSFRLLSSYVIHLFLSIS